VASPPAGLDAVYRAPGCKPPGDLDAIRVSVYTPNTRFTRLTKLVRIIDKDWQIEVTYRSQSLCVLTAIWSLDYSRGHDGTFSLDDQLRVNDFIPGLKHAEETAGAWCPGFGEDCTQPTASPIGELSLEDVAGRLIVSPAGPDFFDLTLRAAIPGTGATVTFTCGTGPPQVFPVFHGAPPVAVQEFLVRFPTLDETVDFVYPSSIESAHVVLKPIRAPGCQ
jgi:hypothetical protein